MKKLHSIYARNLLTITAVLLLSFLILGMVFSMLSYRHVMNDRWDAMAATAEELGRIVNAYSSNWPLDSLELRVALASTEQISKFHILLCRPDGVIVSCSDRELICPHLGMVLPETLLNETETAGQFRGVTDLDGLFRELRCVLGLPVYDESSGALLCCLFLSGRSASMVQIWRDAAWMFAGTALGVMALAFVFSLIATRRQTRPIREMAAAAHRFARGDFSARVASDGRLDEIGALTDAFNVMADSLERSEKQRAEFIANVSHELKTPMTTIAGFTDGILDGTIPPERQREYLTIISSETKRLSRLVRSMLEMSRFQAMDAQTALQASFDVSETVRVALLSLEARIRGRGLDADVRLPEDPVFVLGDRDAILQVIYNLIDNAVKFAAADSVLVLEVWKEDGKAYVAVENRGETIPRDQLPMIFDRFHKTDKSRSMDRDGVGLGLYIVKTILDRHNQDVYVTSEDGVTRFVFTLALRPEK